MGIPHFTKSHGVTDCSPQTPRGDMLLTPEDWCLERKQLLIHVAQQHSDATAWRIIARRARRVLRRFSSSFFVVTRFLPVSKREQVEVVYASVRYPDEIVDSFPAGPHAPAELLAKWDSAYELGRGVKGLRERCERARYPYLAAFTEVEERCQMPSDYYRSFLTAMRHDLNPRCFDSLDDLIDNYIYGSAVVVGYFLAHIYGARSGEFETAKTCARELGIALQLTNFLRDVGEDLRRGRIYLPLDYLAEQGLEPHNLDSPQFSMALAAVRQRLCSVADGFYAQAEAKLSSFNPDSVIAIEACIRLYRELNRRIATSAPGTTRRASVPATQKFALLPTCKYWRVPLAYAADSLGI